MGKVSILKSFSLAAAVLCIVGISVSPSFAKVEKVGSKATLKATVRSAAEGSAARTLKANDYQTEEYDTNVDPLESISTVSLVRIPTNVSDLAKKQCNEDKHCQAFYQSGAGYNATGIVGPNPSGNLQRAPSHCSVADNPHAKGYCYQCKSDSECTAKYPHCYKTDGRDYGVCVKMEDSECVINGQQYHIIMFEDGSVVNDPSAKRDLDSCVECSNDDHCKTKHNRACLKKKLGQNYFQCVQCTSDSFCSGSTPSCLTTAVDASGTTKAFYQCRECTADNRCDGKANAGSGTKCLNSLSYSNNAYTCGCTSKSHCGGAGSGLICLTEAKSSDPNKNKCVAGCETDADCATNFGDNKVCNVSTKKCRYPQNDAECAAKFPATPYFSQAKGQCVVCLTDNHCTSSSAPFCNTSTNQCHANCNVTSGHKTCAQANASKPVCNGGTCVQCDASNGEQCKPSQYVCNQNQGTSCGECTGTPQCQSLYGSNYVCATKTAYSGNW